MDVEPAWLRTWIQVVDSAGFARAAARLHPSQPRVSAGVASLEHVLTSQATAAAVKAGQQQPVAADERRSAT